ncbi:hypothetical protein XELAEV_18008146mg [Xenopus laevis]|uniref:Transmembrane protein 174 n=1 Tax=Xenopus laevis TaxID=8355 RepID=A0A974E2P8_XENLA|nr:hypothetical protein XELAEV_18008146mg [Xenopus laevis]
MEQNNSHEDELSSNVYSVSSYPSNQSDVHVSSGDKGWATLMFSGIFLALVGIALTVLAWVNSKASYFDWTRLVGPIMMTAGVLCVLISVWKFMVLTSCQPCKSTEEAPVDTEQFSGGQSFVFTGINQPITFHGATVVQYIPPPYSSQDFAGGATPLSPNSNPNSTTWANGASLCPPQYYNIYPMDNPAFLQDNPSPAQLSMIGLYDSLPDPAWHSEDFPGANRTNEPPPSYDEIFPTIRRSGTADHSPKLS